MNGSTPESDGPDADGIPAPTTVLDGHNDVLLRLRRMDDPVTAFAEGTADCHLDLQTARDGGLGAGLFAAFARNEERPDVKETDDGYRYPLPDAVDHADAREDVYELLALLHHLVAEVDDLQFVRTVADLDACRANGTLGVVAHLEGAEAVAPDLSNLDFLYAAGVRSIGPVWSRPNEFGHGVPARFPGEPDSGPGLTAAGRDLVRACEERGILVDGAHMTERGIRDTAAALDGPFVVSHAGAHAIHPHSRSLTDDLISLIADRGGLVGITFSATQLGATATDEDVPLSVVLDHVEHVADVGGVEAVALGSDFDGARIPEDVGDASGLRPIVEGLSDRGFDDDEVRAIAWDNWRRVLESVWN